jgi:hypothetical protein
MPSQVNELNGGTRARIWQMLNRKIWLPKSLYTALPFLYLGLGAYAIGTALFIAHWSWIVPYFMIAGIACLHAGMVIATLRWKNRKARPVKGLPKAS